MIKILIADDQELMRQSLTVILNSVHDFEVTESVEDGREAVRSVRSNKPDVILMDICLHMTESLPNITLIHMP